MTTSAVMTVKLQKQTRSHKSRRGNKRRGQITPRSLARTNPNEKKDDKRRNSLIDLPPPVIQPLLRSGDLERADLVLVVHADLAVPEEGVGVPLSDAVVGFRAEQERLGRVGRGGETGGGGRGEGAFEKEKKFRVVDVVGHAVGLREGG